MGQNPNLTAFTSKNQVFCRPEWNKGGPHEKEFSQFSNAKMRFLNNKDKKGVTGLVFISPSWFMALKLSKIVSSLQIFADVSKKSKAVIAIYVYASESSRFALLENGVGYFAMT